MLNDGPHLDVVCGTAHIATDRAGSGHRPTLAFLHAGVADRRSWRAITATLSERFETIAYDRRGFGDTSAVSGAFSHVEDLHCVLDHLGAGRVWLVGSSQGGRIAIDATLADPDRVLGLVLVSPAVSGAEVDHGDLSPAAREIVKHIEAAQEAGDPEAENRWEIRLWLDGPDSPEGRVDGDARRLALEMNARALEAPDPGEEMVPPSAIDRVSEITVPTLLVWGDLDLAPLPARWADLARAIPSATVAVMPGTAHLPYLERPGEFSAMVRSFVAQHTQ